MPSDLAPLRDAYDTIARVGWEGWLGEASSTIHPKTALFSHTTAWVWSELLTRIDASLIPENPWHNRDFILELFVLKFESLQLFKPGLIALRPSLFQAAGCGRYFLEAEYRAHKKMISHFFPSEAPNLLHQLQSHALFGLYFWAFDTWLHDDTLDLAATTVFIDTRLQQGEKWLERYR